MYLTVQVYTYQHTPARGGKRGLLYRIRVFSLHRLEIACHISLFIHATFLQYCSYCLLEAIVIVVPTNFFVHTQSIIHTGGSSLESIIVQITM